MHSYFGLLKYILLEAQGLEFFQLPASNQRYMLPLVFYLYFYPMQMRIIKMTKSVSVRFLGFLLVLLFAAFPTLPLSAQNQAKADTSQTRKQEVSRDTVIVSYEFSQEADGYWRARYPDGTVMAEGKMKPYFRLRYMGRIYLMEGDWRFYDTDGKLLDVIKYHKGEEVLVP